MRPILWLSVVALCGAALAFVWSGSRAAQTAAASPPAADAAVSAAVRVAPLRRGTLAETETAVGTVTNAVNSTTFVTFQRPVLVQRVFVLPGATVHRGQPLLQVLSAPASDMAFIQAQTAVRYATAELARVEQLASAQLATQSQVDAARGQLADARARLDAARRQGQGRGLQVVHAAFDGVVTTVSAAPGAQLAAGSAALALAPAGRSQATVGVTPEVSRLLLPGQTATVQAVFDPDQAATARIVSVSGMIDPRSRRVDVVLSIPPQADWALPGLAIKARFSVRPWSGWVVPRQAVLRDATGQAYVFQDDRGRARRVNVLVEADQAESTGVTGPLDPALPLVVLGNDELTDGMALRVRP